jgi:cell division protein FtsB
MSDAMKLTVGQLRDGSLVLSCGDGEAETDLVFASGAMHGDPQLDDQRAILDAIVATQVEHEAMRAEIERLRAWTDQDEPLPEDDAIAAAFPLFRSKRHDLYAEAIRLVGAKRSKGALVDLVNWLLHERDALRADAERLREDRDNLISANETYRAEVERLRASAREELLYPATNPPNAAYGES